MATHKGNKELHDLLTSMKVRDLPQLQNQTVMEFGKDDLIRDVNDALVGRGVLSAPVYDHEAKKYIGIIDLRDIVAFVLSLHKTEGPIVFTADKIVDFSGMNKFCPISGDATVLEAMKEMNSRGLHRMPIMETPEKVGRMLTQSDIIHWLHSVGEKMGPEVKKTVSQLRSEVGGIGGLKQLLLFITEEDMVVSAFEKMQTFNVHGIPVLDSEGRIVGNISVSDMRHIVKWDISALDAKAKEFFAKLNPDRIPLVTCTVETSLEEVIKQLATTGVHRTYVVDKERKPEDIVTLSNVIDALVTLATGRKS